MTTRKAEEISGNDNEENENTPVAKKLKSSPTDLVLLIGEEKYEYHCHAVFMAAQSDFIDAALASPMRESQTNVIELLDITPKIWGLMMKIVDAPHSIHKLKITMSQIVVVAEKFDKYQFVNGFASCTARISTEFHKLAPVFCTQRAKAELHLDHVIQTALQCAHLGLEDSMPSIYAFFKLMLSMPGEGKYYFGGLIFNPEQLKLLQPLIAKGRLVGDKWTEEEILCPLFPKHYLATCLSVYEEKRFGQKHHRMPLKYAHIGLKKTKSQKIKLACLQKESNTNASPGFSGLPSGNETLFGGDRNFRINLHRFTKSGNWVVTAVVQQRDGSNPLQVLWSCPMSKNFVNYPPRKGWVKMNPSAPDGSLRVELDDKGLAAGTARRSRPVAAEQPRENQGDE